MSATSVWVHLYYEGKDKPNGDPVRIYQSDVPRDRVWDIGTLKGLVHARKSKSLEHCDPDDLTVYPPKTCANCNSYKPGKKLSEVIDELKNRTPPTFDDYPLVAVAPAPPQKPQADGKKNSRFGLFVCCYFI